MNEAKDYISLTLVILNHLLPLILSVALIATVWIVKKYLPQLHYIKLVTDAVDAEGINNLAKYMARKNGGPHINTDSVWEAFVPAAQAVSDRYHLHIDQ